MTEEEPNIAPVALATSPAEPHFPLFRLPRELRDRIYSLVLVSPNPITWPAAPQPTRTISPALVVASRAICDESAAVMYKENTFQFLHPSDANMFNYLCMPTFARTITRLHLPIRDKDARLWFSYFSSTNPRRSLVYDFPALKSLDITFYSIFWQLIHVGAVEKYKRWPADPRLRELCLQLEGRIPPGCEARVSCVMACAEGELNELLRTYPDELKVVSAEGESLAARRQGYRFLAVDIVLELRVTEGEFVLG